MDSALNRGLPGANLYLRIISNELMNRFLSDGFTKHRHEFCLHRLSGFLTVVSRPQSLS